MKKQFAGKTEFNNWIAGWTTKNHDINDMVFGYDEKEDVGKMTKELKEQGYDLDDLTNNGHAYEFAGHTNNGWLYEDEADMEYIRRTGSNREIRKRTS